MILQFDKNAYKGEIDIKKNSQCPAGCRRMLLDDYDRTLECADCGRSIDPFSYLLKIAKEKKMLWKNADIQLRIIQREIEEKKKELESLRRKIQYQKKRNI